MLDFEISYSSRKTKVTGPSKVATATVEEFFEFVQGNLVLVAKELLKQEQDAGRFPKEEYITIVDNKVNGKEENVKPLGKIEYVSKLEDISEVIIDIFKFVDERSPTRSGYYKSMNILMYNGKVVAKGTAEVISFFNTPRDFTGSDRFRIINLAPYARKLENLGIKKGTRGKTVGKNYKSYRTKRNSKGNRVRVPNGAYWLAKNTARRTYPQLKNNIKFSYIPVSSNIAKTQNTRSFTPNSFKFATGKGKGRPYLYPSITITVNPSSFTESSGFTESGNKL